MSTDTELSFLKAMEIYSIRWSIEVFFKECKQYFNLGKCQAQDFDSQIADTTISLIQYIMMAYLKRIRDYGTIGNIFSECKDFVREYTIAERIWGLVRSIMSEIATVFELSLEKVMEKLFTIPEFEKMVLKIIGNDFDDFQKI